MTSRGDMLQLVNGFELSRAVQVAAGLGIADLLVDGPRHVSALADASGAHAPTLYRVLRALASAGIFVESAGGRFELSALAEYLRSDRPDSVRQWAIATGEPAFWSSWGALAETVRTGQPAFGRVHGMSNWDYRAANPEEGAAFDAAMTANSHAGSAAVTAAYDFSGLSIIADIGGGQGALLAAILAAQPATRGILFDHPRVLSSGARCTGWDAVADRCQVVAGDFFRSVPTGADAYVLKNVLVDWDDARAAHILRTCRAAMPATGKLLVVEALLDQTRAERTVCFSDIRMLVMTGGQVRTASDFQALFGSAGFQLASIYPTPSYLSILEATTA